jgi:hypothetical protein
MISRTNDIFDFLERSLIPICILFLGLLGNLIGILVFFRKNLLKFPTRNLYISLAIFDTIYLVYRMLGELTIENGISMYLISNNWCKIFRYFRYSLGPISAWLLVYISIDKFISIQFPNFKLIKLVKFQNTVIFLIVIFNLIYYIPFFIYSKLFIVYSNETNILNNTNYINNTNNELNCYFTELYHKKVLYMMDLINSTLIPFILMFIFSILLIYTIFKSRLRILRLNSAIDRKKLRKDIKFAFTSILLNVTFCIINLPVCVANLLNDISEYYYKLLLYLFFISFCINYYILFTFNSVFRKELFLIFNIISNDNSF